MADELTVLRAQQRIARSMGWKRPTDWPSDMPVTELLNEVGEWFVSAEDWNFLTRPPTWLATVNGQGYCDLPADFTRHLALFASTQNGIGITPADPTAVALAQATGTGPSSTYLACFTFGSPTVAGPKAKARLDLGPIPTSDVAQAFVLAYKGGWTTVAKSDDHIVLPGHVTALYVRACCAWMGGLEQEKRGSVEDRLDRLVTSSLWQAAVDRDDTMQQDLGMVQGGVGAQFLAYGEDEWPFQRVQGVVPIGP